MENQKTKKKIMHAVPVGICASMLTTTLLQPLDMVKVRMQLGQGSGAHIASNMLKFEGGYAAFYKGLSAALLRVPLQHFVRVGSSSILATVAIEANHRKPLSARQKAMNSVTAGMMTGAFTMPIGLAQIRMQADATFPTAHRRNYTNVFNALNRVIADEGVQALWRGLGPSFAKNFVHVTGCTFSSLLSFSYLKYSLGCGDTTSRIGADGIAAFFGCGLSLPFDYVKTQLQNMQPDAYGKYPYTGFFDCARKTFKTGGLAQFYSGFYFYYFGVASWSMMTMFFMKLLGRLDASISGKKVTVNTRWRDV
ncbi:hypothetical protein PIB30_022639 [Stylosanthes scabra]|uniref:Uncharacterized protein n=1 Tax=Stylosanthes scabra TaxID=79078 RepID=A0ABU6T9H7_9FABA|nr:hypothetical protein [Stylosanthes scabra]